MSLFFLTDKGTGTLIGYRLSSVHRTKNYSILYFRCGNMVCMKGPGEVCGGKYQRLENKHLLIRKFCSKKINF